MYKLLLNYPDKRKKCTLRSSFKADLLVCARTSLILLHPILWGIANMLPRRRAATGKFVGARYLQRIQLWTGRVKNLRPGSFIVLAVTVSSLPGYNSSSRVVRCRVHDGLEHLALSRAISGTFISEELRRLWECVEGVGFTGFRACVREWARIANAFNFAYNAPQLIFRCKTFVDSFS